METERPAAPEELKTLRGLVERAGRHEPVQYLLGEAWFYTPRVQFWRAHLGILCVSIPLLTLSWQGQGGLLWILYFLPGGLWQFVQRRRDAFLRRIAEKHELIVPSLVADKRVEGIADHAADEVDLLKGALGGAPPPQPAPVPVGAGAGAGR